MRIRHLVVMAVLVTAVFGFAFPASAVTINELLAQIAALQAQLAALQAQQGTATPIPWCHTFNTNLGFANSGSTEVGELKTALIKSGVWPNEAVTYNYDEETAAYVVKFQQKYFISNPTGYTGPATRAKLNALYGCNNTTPIPCLNGSGPLLPGQSYCNPTQPTVTFTASNLDNRAYNTDSITLQVGETVKFAYSATNATNCYVYNDGILNNNLYGTDVNGVQDINLTQGATSGRFHVSARQSGSTTYTVTCSNASGVKASKSITLRTVTSTQPSITVTSPNGGENWQIGSVQAVKWTTNNIPANASILVRLRDSAGVERYFYGNSDISNTVNNAGFFYITVPLTLTPGQYKAEVKTFINGQSYFDASDNYFTISSSTVCTPNWQMGSWGACVSNAQSRTVTDLNNCGTTVGKPYSNQFCTPTQPSITITSPNGGENWKVGETHNITWTSANMSSGAYVNLSIYYAYFTGVPYSMQIARVPASSGSYSWIIPATLGGVSLVGNTFKSYITLDSDSSVSDAGNNSFTISAASTQPSITVTSPNGGENVTKGSTQRIRWESQGVSSVYIKLRKGNVYYGISNIASSVSASQGYFDWNVPTTLPDGNDYSIRVLNSNNAQISDDSNNYLTISAASSVCMESNWTSNLSPTTCPSTRTQTKTWTKVGTCTGGVTHPISETISCNYAAPTCTSFTYGVWGACSSSGTQTRTIISSLPSGCQGGSSITSRSCTPPVVPFIRISSPASTDVWAAGTKHTISWTYTGFTYMRIILSNSAILYSDYIVQSIPASSGSYTWTIPSTLKPGDSYYLFMQGSQSASFGDAIVVGQTSDKFTISPAAAPTCTSWTYSAWSACAPNGTRARTTTSSLPAGCTGGSPVLSETCVYVAPCTESNWTSVSSPLTCPSTGLQTKTWTKVGTCIGGVSHMRTETLPCEYLPPCVSFTYSAWGACYSNGIQSRTTISSSPSRCTGGAVPSLTRPCVPAPSAGSAPCLSGSGPLLPGQSYCTQPTLPGATNYTENSLASISSAIQRLLTEINKLAGE